MASVPAMPPLSVEEYLRSTYHPDMEYLDGALVARSMPTPAHNALQMIVGEHLRRFRREGRFAVLPEVRTELVPRSCYRVPDLLVCGLPIPSGRVVHTVPWVVIEILLPDDRMRDQLERFREYAERGVPQIVLLDPDRHVAHRFDNGSLLQTDFTELPLPGGMRVPFATAELFRQLQEELAEQ